MNRNSRAGQLVVFVIALILLNVIFQLFGLQVRFSIIGSVVLTLVVGGVMTLLSRSN
ncbi:MAG: hypothetical protein ACN4GZ_14140 [Acidimicrobiales bacterium]